MMREVVEYVLNPEKHPLPPVLELAFQAKKWNTLPQAGGIRDQRIGELERMMVAHNVYSLVKSYKDAKSKADWIETHSKEDWELYNRLVDIKSGTAKS